MAKRKKTGKKPVAYTLSQRQFRWLVVCFLIVDASLIWLGFGGFSSVMPYSEIWRVNLLGPGLTFIQVTLLVLLFQWMRQARRQKSLLQFVDADDESFRPIGDEMEA